jgi:hypothetical protein
MAGSIGCVEYKGKRILSIDFTGCEMEEIVAVVQEGKKLIAAEPPNSVLTLTIVTGARTNSAVTRVMKEFTLHNKPYVKAGAVVGLDGLKSVIFDAVMKFSGRNLTAHEDIEKAKEWLIGQ